MKTRFPGTVGEIWGGETDEEINDLSLPADL